MDAPCGRVNEKYTHPKRSRCFNSGDAGVLGSYNHRPEWQEIQVHRVPLLRGFVQVVGIVDSEFSKDVNGSEATRVRLVRGSFVVKEVEVLGHSIPNREEGIRAR